MATSFMRSTTRKEVIVVSNDTKQREYRCLIYLKDDRDKKLLAANAFLYGKIVPSTRMIFMTPYPAPVKCVPLIGIVQKKSGHEHEQPLLLNVVFKEKSSLMVSGFLNNNERIELPVEIIYKTACYERTPFLQSEMDLLWNTTVVIIGCGTGGSKIAMELARAGVGHLKLCDLDTFDYANISRHEGDLLDIGKPKPQVVAERIYRINPAIKVEMYNEDIFERTLKEIQDILTGNLVVASTDKTSIQLLINELTHKFAIPGVFGGCYEEALGGEVFFTLPGERMPCLACLRSGLKQPEINTTIDYSTASGPEDYQGQPGLHAAVDQVTCIEVQICLGILLRACPTSKLARLIDPHLNFILIGGALGSGFYRFRKPFDIFFQPLSGPRKTCPVCSGKLDLSDFSDKSFTDTEDSIAVIAEDN